MLLQVADEEVADPEVEQEPGQHVPEGRVVGKIGLDRAGDHGMQDVGRQRVLAERPEQADAQAAAVAGDDEQGVDRQREPAANVR